MTSFLKRWRTARPRVCGAAASEEWEELSSRLSEASDREEEDTVVVASASSAAAPPAKAEASLSESKFEEEDTRPFALLRLRIAAFGRHPSPFGCASPAQLPDDESLTGPGRSGSFATPNIDDARRCVHGPLLMISHRS